MFFRWLFNIKKVSWYEIQEITKALKEFDSEYFCSNVSGLRIRAFLFTDNIYIRILLAVFAKKVLF